MSIRAGNPSAQDVLVEAMEEFSGDPPDQVLIIMRYPRSGEKAAYNMVHNDLSRGDALWLVKQAEFQIIDYQQGDE